MNNSIVYLGILFRVNSVLLLDRPAHVLNLPAYRLSFHEAGTTSFINDILFAQYNAAIHLGSYQKNRESLNIFQPSPSTAIGRQTHFSDLLVCAVNFGRIVQISQNTIPIDTIPARLSHVQNSNRYKEEVQLSQSRSSCAHPYQEAFLAGIKFGAK